MGERCRHCGRIHSTLIGYRGPCFHDLPPLRPADQSWRTKGDEMSGARTPHQQRVDEFMRLAKQELPEKPTMPDEKTRKLRAKLILEEAFETIQELGFDLVVNDEYWLENKECFDSFVEIRPPLRGRQPSLEGIADGCADIAVVTTGTLSTCGISDVALQREVDENNLRKFEHRCPKCDRVYKDGSMPVNEEICHIDPMTRSGDLVGKPGVRHCLCCGYMWQSGYHNEYGKWVKPSTHKSPDIARVLEEQDNA